MSALRVRPGRSEDLAAIDEIYAHYIQETAITFDLEPAGAEARRAWFAQFGETGRHRLFVAERDAVVGWSCSHGFRPKGAYQTSVETTIYLRPEATGTGAGTALYRALFDALVREDVHRAYAGITLPNPASEALHRRFGFEPVGVFHEVGRKHDRWWDVRWYEKRL